MTELEIRDQCTHLADLLVKKNHDYGDSVEKAPILLPTWTPLAGVYVRMSDKIERMRSLLGRLDEPEVSESLDDTIRDLAGYCILALIMRDNSR